MDRFWFTRRYICCTFYLACVILAAPLVCSTPDCPPSTSPLPSKSRTPLFSNTCHSALTCSFSGGIFYTYVVDQTKGRKDKRGATQAKALDLKAAQTGIHSLQKSNTQHPSLLHPTDTPSATLTCGGASHALEGHDARVLRDDRSVEVAEAVHVLGGVLEEPSKLFVRGMRGGATQNTMYEKYTRVNA